jgi:hypothetical protein
MGTCDWFRALDKIGKRATFEMQHKTLGGALLTIIMVVVLLTYCLVEMVREFNMTFEYTFNKFELPAVQSNLFAFRDDNFLAGITLQQEDKSISLELDPKYGRFFVLDQNADFYPTQTCYEAGASVTYENMESKAPTQLKLSRWNETTFMLEWSDPLFKGATTGAEGYHVRAEYFDGTVETVCAPSADTKMCLFGPDPDYVRDHGGIANIAIAAATPGADGTSTKTSVYRFFPLPTYQVDNNGNLSEIPDSISTTEQIDDFIELIVEKEISDQLKSLKKQ